MNNRPAYSLRVVSPLGDMLVEGTSNAIQRLGWMTEASPCEAGPCCPLLKDCAAQLEAYFKGRLTQFDLPLAPHGTAFQTRVWQQLADIPFGSTCSYGELANRLTPPSSARAVGGAVGRNPLLILLPCHRVMGADGSLTGFSSGLQRKTWLLAHEGVAENSQLQISGI